MDRVWSVISKQESLFQGEPHLKKVKVVNHLSPIQELVEYTMSISRFLPTFVYTTKVDYKKPENSIFFKRVSGSFNEFEGFCQLAPVENGKKTLLLYGLKIDIGFFVPQFIVAGILKRELPSILNFVEKQVHQQS
jgi:hypothetical protein